MLVHYAVENRVEGELWLLGNPPPCVMRSRGVVTLTTVCITQGERDLAFLSLARKTINEASKVNLQTCLCVTTSGRMGHIAFTPKSSGTHGYTQSVHFSERNCILLFTCMIYTDNKEEIQFDIYICSKQRG